MSEKVALCSGRLYRGVFIYGVTTGEIFILNDVGGQYDFISPTEAEAFVDACLAMSGALIGSLG